MDLTTFNRLTVTYQGIAYNVACHILNDPDVAADVVETSVAGLRQSGRYLEVDRFRCRLLASVIHACLERVRTQQRADRHVDPRFNWDPILAGADSSLTPLLSIDGAVAAGLQAMDAEARIVLLLHDRYDCSDREVATMTGTSPGAVRRRLARARIELRNYLIEHSDFPPVAVHSRSP